MGVIPPDEVTVTVHGDVPPPAPARAREKVGQLARRAGGPVLLAGVELTMAPDPARERPAIAEATLDVNGSPVRAQVAAREMHEAVDLLVDRLARRLDRHQQRRRREGRERYDTGRHGEDGWRHGDLPTQRPEHHPRPHDEREVVRRKSFAVEPVTVDEAAFDLDRLGHDFHLFRELSTDRDAVVAFDGEAPGGEGGGLTLQLPEGTAGDPTAGAAVPVRVLPPAPSLDERDALERLESGREPFVFATDPGDGRGYVAYRRYDGHWGVVGLD